MGVMTGLLLLLWAGVAVSTPVDLQKRIIGGENCKLDERLYHVILEGSNGELCGGSLIDDQWILTAGHCWLTTPGWTMTAYLRKSPNSDKLVPMQIEDHHPFVNQTKTHDIMLLKLKKPNLNPTEIKPIRLPDCGKPLNINDTVEVAGYGSKTMGPNNIREIDVLAPVLQCGNIKVINCTMFRECLKRNYPVFYLKREDQHWQCYQSPGVDTSPGDSGGGVVFKGMIYGVHSFRGNHSHGCVNPSGFMDVCEYMDWIVNTTDIRRPGSRPGP